MVEAEVVLGGLGLRDRGGTGIGITLVDGASDTTVDQADDVANLYIRHLEGVITIFQKEQIEE